MHLFNVCAHGGMLEGWFLKANDRHLVNRASACSTELTKVLLLVHSNMMSLILGNSVVGMCLRHDLVQETNETILQP